MASFKGFPGHYHPDPWSLEHRPTWPRPAGGLVQEQPLTWVSRQGRARVVPAPQDDIAAAQWFVAFDLGDLKRAFSLEALDQRRCDYVVDLWPEGGEAPSDCLPEFYASVGEAREAGWTELLRVARALQDHSEQDPAQPGGPHAFDWAHRFTVRPCQEVDDG